MIGPGRDDSLPLGGPVTDRADGFGEHGLAWGLHYIADQIKAFRKAQEEVLVNLPENLAFFISMIIQKLPKNAQLQHVNCK